MPARTLASTFVVYSAVVFSITTSCGPDPAPDSGDNADLDGDDGDADGDASAGPLLDAGGTGTENHGSVKIELRRSTASGEDPFEGTDSMTVTLFYTECLQDFYLREHPAWAQDGTNGGPVWETWGGLLCDREALGDEILDCEVEDITQNLDQGLTNAAITYKVNDPNLDSAVVHFGPMPTEELAGCVPEVEVRATSVAGYDAASSQIWEVESFDGFNVAVTGQSGAIRVTVKRSG
jgi:hypothetical protein